MKIKSNAPRLQVVNFGGKSYKVIPGNHEAIELPDAAVDDKYLAFLVENDLVLITEQPKQQGKKTKAEAE